MSKMERNSVPATGGSALLAVFAVLCLTVFAVLGLSTALADKRLNDASVQAVTGYYEADYKAEEIFARIRAGEMPEGVEEENGIYRYTCPVSETQTLWVELANEADGWKVIRWQTVTEMEWSETEPDIWDGE